jgi:hypothetical protein
MEFIDVRWFCGHTNVGIVKVNDKYEGIKYYIGAFEYGNTNEEDIQNLMDWGTTYPKEAGDCLFSL